jgi:hypothetical protein
MTIKFADVSGVLTVPGAYPEWTVAASNSGLSTTGAIVLLGEADSGPSYLDEDVVASSGFGPQSAAAVAAKFGGGRLVDAYNMAIAASKDPDVKGSPSVLYLVKTNQGTKASKTLSGTYAVIKNVLEGANGNLTYVQITHPTADTASVRITRAFDNVDQTLTFGNHIVLQVGAKAATTHTMTVSSTGITSASITGVAASGTATIVSAVAGNKLTINGVDFTAVVSGPSANEWVVGGSDTESAHNLAAAINASTHEDIEGIVTADHTLGLVSVTAVTAGTAGNAITFTKTGNPITLNPLTGVLAGGVDYLAALSIVFANFRTIGDVASFIDAQEGWAASAPTMYRQSVPSVLDQGTVNVNSPTGALVADIKKNAYEFSEAIDSSGVLEVYTAPTTGLPAVESFYLTGGARGITTDAKVTAALLEVKRLSTNFLVPLFSKDAASDTDTDSNSTYTIAGINAAVLSHVLACSQFKVRKPRQAFLSLSDTYANVKLAAQGIGAYRASLCFLESLVSNAAGTLTWFDPWAQAVQAAAMQAAAGYKPIFNKALNSYGAQAPQSDFFVENIDELEDALNNGLLIAVPRQSDGTMAFLSDQTTYGVDENVVYNSIQGTYAADVVALTSALRMDRAFTGKSFADVSASVALSYFTGILDDMRRLKWITASDTAPLGYRNALVTISAPALLCSCEIVLSTGIYFIPIKFKIIPNTQSASA